MAHDQHAEPCRRAILTKEMTGGGVAGLSAGGAKVPTIWGVPW